MDKKTIDNIVWWIPFKNLRNAVRELLLYNLETKTLYNNISNSLNNLENNINNVNSKLSPIEYKSNISANFAALICEKLEIKDFNLPIPCPPDEYKRMTIVKYAKEYECRILVETGTYFGETALFCKDYFDKIYTIELLDVLYLKALNKFKELKSIKVIKGDSSKELPIVLKEIDTKAIFWLDGHYCGDNFTARGEKETPIMEELNSILEHSIKNHVILIDDARCFGVWPDYPSIEELYNYIKKVKPNCDFQIKNDIIRIVL